MLKKIAAAWGVLGVSLLVGSAIVRLTPIALAPVLGGTMTPGQWLAYVGFAAANAYLEGYRGFQLRFAPRVAARALHLSHSATAAQALLAPLFCMGLLWATRRRWITSWVVLLVIIGLVNLVRRLPQPWRGVVDAGVVVGLAWGLVAILVEVVRVIRHGRARIDPDLPPTPPPAPL